MILSDKGAVCCGESLHYVVNWQQSEIGKLRHSFQANALYGIL